MRPRWFCLRGRYFSFKNYLLILLFGGFLFCVFFLKSLGQLELVKSAGPTPTQPDPPALIHRLKHDRVPNINTPDVAKLRQQWLAARIEKFRRKQNSNERTWDFSEDLPPNPNIHIFYYAWYETPEYDNRWQHWNHAYLPNWKPNDKKIYPTGSHSPPADIGSNFYPQLGCYSSRDPSVINAHMKQIKYAGVGVLVVSWYPPGDSDGSAFPPDTIFPTLLDAAVQHGLKITPHIEPYEGRNAQNFAENIMYFNRKYRNHTGLYKMDRGGKMLPVFYVYDSYRTSAAEWRKIFEPNAISSETLRSTDNDGIFLGLVVDLVHKNDIKRGYFDGFYTYFASNGFSYGSSWKNWKLLAKFAGENNLLFVPSIGPGYIDTQVRPWNSGNSRHRRRGTYYEVGWRTAISAPAPIMSITSFNEWHEGTQIEPAIPFQTDQFQYLDYEPEGPMFYLNLTRYWAKKFRDRSKTMQILGA